MTLKIRLRPFRTYTRSRTLESPTGDADVVTPIAHELLGRVELDTPVRLLGVGLSGLMGPEDRDAGDPEPASEASGSVGLARRLQA